MTYRAVSFTVYRSVNNLRAHVRAAAGALHVSLLGSAITAPEPGRYVRCSLPGRLDFVRRFSGMRLYSDAPTTTIRFWQVLILTH